MVLVKGERFIPSVEEPECVLMVLVYSMSHLGLQRRDCLLSQTHKSISGACLSTETIVTCFAVQSLLKWRTVQRCCPIQIPCGNWRGETAPLCGSQLWHCVWHPFYQPRLLQFHLCLHSWLPSPSRLSGSFPQESVFKMSLCGGGAGVGGMRGRGKGCY